MVVLGGWYLYRGDRLCQVIKTAGGSKSIFMVMWADTDSFGYVADLHLTPLPEGLTPLLLSSNSTGETK